MKKILSHYHNGLLSAGETAEYIKETSLYQNGLDVLINDEGWLEEMAEDLLLDDIMSYSNGR